MIDFEDGKRIIIQGNENKRKGLANQLLSSTVATTTTSEGKRFNTEKKVRDITLRSQL